MSRRCGHRSAGARIAQRHSARPDRTATAFADIRIVGDRPWDVQVHDVRLYARLVGCGSLGLGESYMHGWWDAASLDEILCRLLRAHCRHRRITVTAMDRGSALQA